MTEKNDAPKISPFEAAANAFIQNAVACTVNGLRTSIPAAPLANLMIKTCSAFGVCIGQIFSIGALGDIFPLRAECIKAFSEGVKSVKIQPPEQAPPVRLNS